MLPEMTVATELSKADGKKRLLIIAEGFEARSLSWISSQPEINLFDSTLLCRYSPEEKGKLEAVLSEVCKRSKGKARILQYNRFDPTPFEQIIEDLKEEILRFDEIVVDISVMSKMLIMIILHALVDYSGSLKIVYTEPKTWGPSEEACKKYIKEYGNDHSSIGLSSIGVFDIVRTPRLSSIIMQDCQSMLITFTTSNEHLVNVLLNEVMPSKTLLINAYNPREPWRSEMALQIHQDAINEYNIKDTIISCDLLDYKRAFACMASAYVQNCYQNRIVLAPVGGKIHTVACALLKNCCQDIQIEYPTPESYLFDSYSSEEINNIYEVCFDNFHRVIVDTSFEYKLNG